MISSPTNDRRIRNLDFSIKWYRYTVLIGIILIVAILTWQSILISTQANTLQGITQNEHILTETNSDLATRRTREAHFFEAVRQLLVAQTPAQKAKAIKELESMNLNLTFYVPTK